MDRSTSILALTVLGAACVGGLTHAPLWSVVVCACLLALVGLSRSRNLAVGSRIALVEPVAILISIANAAVMSSASYALGFASLWVWGV